jgi:hypothetical protein
MGGYTPCGQSCCSAADAGSGTYGNATALGLTSTASTGYLYGYQIYISQAGTPGALGMVVPSTSPSAHVVLGLYSDSANLPLNLVAQTVSTAVSSTTLTIPVSSGSIPAGYYWLMAIYDTSIPIYYASNSTAKDAYVTMAFSATLPSSLSPTAYSGSAMNLFVNVH